MHILLLQIAILQQRRNAFPYSTYQPNIEGLSKFQYKCLKKWNGIPRRLKRGWRKESELSLCNSWGQTSISERFSVKWIACLPGMRHGLTKQISLWLVYQQRHVCFRVTNLICNLLSVWHSCCEGEKKSYSLLRNGEVMKQVFSHAADTTWWSTPGSSPLAVFIVSSVIQYLPLHVRDRQGKRERFWRHF